MFGRTRSAIKPFQGKRKKLALLSKPHILQSQMVLLSEHLVLDLDWMEFFRRSCALKKKWLIWGKQTSAASFQALWFVVLVGCCTWKYFFSTRLPSSSRQREHCLWLGRFIRHTWYPETVFKTKAAIGDEGGLGSPQQGRVSVLCQDLRVQQAPPTVCFLCSSGKLNLINLASLFPITFKPNTLVNKNYRD